MVLSSQKRVTAPSLKTAKVLRGQLGKVPSIDWSKNGEYLLSACTDDFLLVWDPKTYNRVALIPVPNIWVMSCAFSPDTSTAAAGGLNNVCRITRLDSEEISSFDLLGHSGFISSCRYINENRLLTSSGDNTCKLWDLQTQQAVSTFEGHERDVMQIAVHDAQPQTFVSGSLDGSCRVWDVRTAKCAATLVSTKITEYNAVTMSPFIHCFASAGENGIASAFDIRALGQTFEYENPQGTMLSCITYSASGRLLFAGNGSSSCNVWDTVTQTSVANLQGHEKPLSCVAMHPDGTTLASSSLDESIRLWHM
ncbi:heterotrimeric G protein beta subunit Git5 [Schizosaccharomyces japonicus yFS275]|uniref:Heterotrimeric G protein beta subunit Git5 n=1 Tax=Schizosaccharomyces japonicus (strain yFS275 / FY16936) TaxID=402676 RepID=B6K398_SCHJY|nr:heterotrimeric G protein beta subunit Git5 [Schizosaccharomyces japonicus yFS275]EEB07955.1 heterotrimeric G protein beta subunit Git5 [Schizosaccharomyces japonicus yFS275]